VRGFGFLPLCQPTGNPEAPEMIQVRFLKSFDDTLSALELGERKKAVEAVEKLLDYFSGAPRPLGLGLRKLRSNYWEIRLGLKVRVLFILDKDLATFVIVGNHESIQRKIQHINT
jgi:mRNA-degrading endonuclease RelE of RelBE toxin-antitoxin system